MAALLENISAFKIDFVCLLCLTENMLISHLLK